MIGINDSGKTAIIDAIKLVLKTHAFEWIKVGDDDFFDKGTKLRALKYAFASVGWEVVDITDDWMK